MISKKFSRLITIFMLVFSAVAMFAVSYDAEARRLGGGMSFGRQSSNVMKKSPAAQTKSPTLNRSQNAGAAGANAKPRTGMSRFLGPLTGIAAGLGIAALLSSLGLGGALLEFLSSAIVIGLVIAAIMFIVRRLRGGQQSQRPAMQGIFNQQHQGGASSFSSKQPMNGFSSSSTQAPSITAVPSPNKNTTWFVPEGFDTQAFLTIAKKQFIHIQSLWDKQDVEGLKEFLTDDLLKDMLPQLEAQVEDQQTEVLALDAELLGVEEVFDGHLASVKFNGSLKESPEQAPFAFEEVWNLYKGADGGWILAGIQQTQH